MSSYSMANLLPKMSNNMAKASLSAVYSYALDKYVKLIITEVLCLLVLFLVE